MSLLILFFILSIGVSFLCSIWEAVLLSITPSYVKMKEKEGGATGTLLEKFKEDIDRPLSAILTLNTIAHTVGAIGVGAQAGKLFGSHHFDFLGLALSYESLIAGIMTLAILILSEIIPKTLGANYWRALTPFTVTSINLLILALYPLVWLSQLITRKLKREKHKSVLSRADFTVMAQVGAESGALDESESVVIKNLLRLKELKVSDVMTPRTVLISAEEGTTCQDFHEAHKDLRFSRIPIYEDQPDNITGLALKDDILTQLAENRYDTLLKEIKRPVLFVREDTKLQILFEKLTREREHLAVVVDQFGALLGLVTMEDVLETLLGLEIMDETDQVADLQKLAREQWEKRAKKIGLVE